MDAHLREEGADLVEGEQRRDAVQRRRQVEDDGGHGRVAGGRRRSADGHHPRGGVARRHLPSGPSVRVKVQVADQPLRRRVVHRVHDHVVVPGRRQRHLFEPDAQHALHQRHQTLLTTAH